MRILLIILVLSSTLLAEVTFRAFTDSSYLLRGEPTIYTIESSSRLNNLPKDASEEQFKLIYINYIQGRTSQGTPLYQYRYQFSSLHTGEHTIPSFDIAGQQVPAQNISIQVFPSSKLNFETIKIGIKDVTYSTALFLPDKELYIGETVPAELKVYLPSTPQHFSVIEQGVPDQKKDGFSVWRMQPSRNQRQQLGNPRTFFTPQGQYHALTYRSAAHASRTGTVSIGPGTIRPVFRTVNSTNGQMYWDNLPVYLPIKQITRKALPLPANAPSSFKGAVGKFEFHAEMNEIKRLSDTDPATLTLKITGTGNLDKIEAPSLTRDHDQWKLYPATKTERAGERRYLSGAVEFTQILRPTVDQKSIPPFEFSFFNPQIKQYETIRSAEVPLIVKSNGIKPQTSSRPLEATQSPVQKIETDTKRFTPAPNESMTGVLGLITLSGDNNTNPSFEYFNYWQAIPAVLSALLAIAIFRRDYLYKFLPSVARKEALKSYKELHKLTESTPFLKKAAQLTQKHLNQEENQSLKMEVETLRDKYCYQKETSKTLPKNSRVKLLNKIQAAIKSSIALVAFSLLFLTTQPLEAIDPTLNEIAQIAAKKEDFSTALYTYQKVAEEAPETADLLYNIGTCYAKLDEPGRAILYLRRALLKDPEHKESLQNLRYLERVNGSLTIERTGLSKLVSKLPRSVIVTIMWIMIWGIILGSLSLLYFKSRGIRIYAWCSFVLGALLLPLACLALFTYPDDGKFSLPTSLAVVTSSEIVTTRTGASNTSDEVIKTPPGSIGKVLEQRGLWAYIGFANDTRGWLNTKHLTMLSPEKELGRITPVEDPTDL